MKVHGTGAGYDCKEEFLITRVRADQSLDVVCQMNSEGEDVLSAAITLHHDSWYSAFSTDL